MKIAYSVKQSSELGGVFHIQQYEDGVPTTGRLFYLHDAAEAIEMIYGFISAGYYIVNAKGTIKNTAILWRKKQETNPEVIEEVKDE